MQHKRGAFANNNSTKIKGVSEEFSFLLKITRPKMNRLGI
jgi:hypothetical protein